MSHSFNSGYTNENLNQIAFPIGGLGSGMFCMDGNGSFSHFSLRHKPEIFNLPLIFGAICVKGHNKNLAKVIQGPTPDWKIMFPWGPEHYGSGMGGRDTTFGLPYFRECIFSSQFPFAEVQLKDSEMPLEIKVVSWSPFIPENADDSSLPTGYLEYSFTNRSSTALNSAFTFASQNFMRQKLSNQKNDDVVIPIENGFILRQPQGEGQPFRQGDFSVVAIENAKVNCQWNRGGWFDYQTELWHNIEEGLCPEMPAYAEGESSPGGSLSIPFALDIGETKTIRIILSWYVPFSELSHGKNKNLDLKKECYRPWYAEKFKDIYEIVEYSKNNYENLHKKSESFAKSLNSLALPHEILEAVSANLSILKSPTVLRQKDGRFWAWEGCFDNGGSCYGSCTHVWNYAQALPHLFPDLERNLRITEFFDSQNEIGHQNFRTSLPIGEADHSFHAAADGQLGGIMKVYREWKISKNTEWLRNIWPQVKQSLNYSINIWDPQKIGMLTAPHHNTYDIEFWGPNGMCTSIYLGALKAASLMANELKEDGTEYFHLYRLGRIKMEKELWNGEYFFHKIQINEKLENENTSIVILPNSSIIEKKTSQNIPKYQYGEGCLADGVIGAWFAEVCQVGEILDPIKVKSHLESVYQYNFKKSFHDHANPQRPTYAMKDESGILLCTWPKGGRLQFPFPYSEEVWTGIEYQIASHLAFMGENEKCLEIVKAVRSRYNGIRRNPYSEFECGQWYGRALSSYSLLQAFGIKPNFWK